MIKWFKKWLDSMGRDAPEAPKRAGWNNVGKQCKHCRRRR